GVPNGTLRMPKCAKMAQSRAPLQGLVSAVSAIILACYEYYYGLALVMLFYSMRCADVRVNGGFASPASTVHEADAVVAHKVSTSLQHERHVRMNALTRWNPFREMEDVQRRMSSLFDWSPFRRTSLLTDDESITAAEWAPLVDIVEDPKGYLIKVELPEVQKDDVKVTVER